MPYPVLTRAIRSFGYNQIALSGSSSVSGIVWFRIQLRPLPRRGTAVRGFWSRRNTPRRTNFSRCEFGPRQDLGSLFGEVNSVGHSEPEVVLVVGLLPERSDEVAPDATLSLKPTVNARLSSSFAS